MIQKFNDDLVALFDKGEPFSLIRIGNMEGHFIDMYTQNKTPAEEFFYWLTLTSGVFPLNLDYIYKIWMPENFICMQNADMLGFVDVSGEVSRNQIIRQHFHRDNTFYGSANILFLDPIALIKDKIENSWLKKLSGKKVLVVSSHINSIKSQYPHLKEIWGEHYVDFELVDVIRSPFNPDMDDRQYPNCTTWDESLSYMKGLIDNYDYDVLLVGAAAYSPMLADYAKQQGKIGITVCGAIQLYFGILGSRWTDGNLNKEWPDYFNEYWKYPISEDLPKNVELFNKFEGAYW